MLGYASLWVCVIGMQICTIGASQGGTIKRVGCTILSGGKDGASELAVEGF